MSHCHDGDHCQSKHSGHGSGSCHPSCNCSCHSSCQCNSCKCGCHSHSSCHEDFAHELLEMADEAWMEILKDKIKAKIEVTSGAHLDKLADLVASSNRERWVNKMKKKQACETYEDKVADFFDTHSS